MVNELSICKKRDSFIDSLKGIAILLVVIGHVVVSMFGEDEAEQNIIFRICYSFHMPLFMAISGFLTGGGTDARNLKWLKKRAFRLLLPWVIWTIVFCIIRFDGWYGFVYYFFVEPAIWFLPCLFLCNLYNYIVLRVKKYKLAIGVIIYVIISIFGIVFNLRIIEDFTIFLPFYFIGYIYKKKTSTLMKEKFKNIGMICCLAIYPLSMFIYTFGTDEAAVKAQKTIEWIGFGNEFVFKAVYWFNSRFIIACLGIGACVAIFKVLYKVCKVVLKPFAFVGQHTMPIYILSGYFYFDALSKINNNLFCFIIGTLICVSMPLVISILLKRYFPKIHKILFG